MAIIKDLPKSKREEYLALAKEKGLNAPNLYLWSEETLLKKLAQLEQKTEEKLQKPAKKSQKPAKKSQKSGKSEHKAEQVTPEEKAETILQSPAKVQLCHICKKPLVNGKCERCGVDYDN